MMSRQRTLGIFSVALLATCILFYEFLDWMDQGQIQSFKQPPILAGESQKRGLETKEADIVNVTPLEQKYSTEPPNNGTSEVTPSTAPVVELEPKYNETRNVDIPKTKESSPKYASSKALKESPHLLVGINASLMSLNKEFSPKWNSKAVIARKGLNNFNASSANRMEIVGNLKVGQKIPDQSARHIMVVTTWRSGSTFLGDLLNHYKGVFYYFEPLHYYDHAKNKDLKQSDIEFIESLLKCQYNQDNIGFLHHVSKPANKFLFKNHNFRLWNSCKNVLPNNKLCLQPEYLNKVCPLYPIKLMKTVRLQLKEVEHLIKDPSLRLKVLFLVRDPRGTYNSRSSATISNWCNKKEQCADPEFGCRQMMENIDSAFDLETRYPGSVRLVRYEDLSMYPYDVVPKMMDFLDLPMIEELDKYIETHTGSEKLKTVRNTKTHKIEHKKNEYGTTKNSTATAFAWREKLTFDHLERIQKACSKPMQKLGYQLLQKPEDVKNKNLPLDSDLESIWPFPLSD